jgi:hypothetical protein
VLSRSKGPTGLQGYAVTREGAARLMYHIGVTKVSNAVDLDVMWLCYHRRLRCLEVSPALIGLYIGPGPASKISDNNPADWVPESENPIGSQSVKAMMKHRLDVKSEMSVLNSEV